MVELNAGYKLAVIVNSAPMYVAIFLLPCERVKIRGLSAGVSVPTIYMRFYTVLSIWVNGSCHMCHLPVFIVPVYYKRGGKSIAVLLKTLDFTAFFRAVRVSSTEKRKTHVLIELFDLLLSICKGVRGNGQEVQVPPYSFDIYRSRLLAVADTLLNKVGRVR
jgi:hypothetical protein